MGSPYRYGSSEVNWRGGFTICGYAEWADGPVHTAGGRRKFLYQQQGIFIWYGHLVLVTNEIFHYFIAAILSHRGRRHCRQWYRRGHVFPPPYNIWLLRRLSILNGRKPKTIRCRPTPRSLGGGGTRTMRGRVGGRRGTEKRIYSVTQTNEPV